MKNKLYRIFSGALVVMSLTTQAWAYVYSSHQSIWTPGPIPMLIRLGAVPATLQDGTNHGTSMQAAMQTWNAQLGTVQFAPQILAKSSTQVDGANDVYFDSTIEGEAFGASVLAVTLVYRSSSVFEIVEADIIFNTAWTWNSYRGSLQSQEDIRRVAIHELGHVLGLGHPDQQGQTVTAVMNSTASNQDSLAADDIAGAQSIYRVPGQTYGPGNDNFANAIGISLANGSTQVTGSTLYATGESGEPSHDPDGGTKWASAWWKWTAPYNGTMSVTTQGSKFDTVLGVYTGMTVSALTLIGNSDDVQSGVTRYSFVSFNVIAGITYYFAVDGWEAASGPAVLNLSYTAIFPPTVTGHPSNRSAMEGTVAQFNGSASGAPAPTFRWQILENGGSWRDLSDDGNFSGAGSSNLVINRATAALNGAQFRFTATNSVGSATSNAATLTVTPAPPSILTQPQSQEVVQGASATFTVGAMGTAPLTYQWFKNSGAISGATTSSLVLTNVERSRDAGSYYVVVSNSLGSATSSSANLAVVTPPVFTRQPAAQSVRRYASTSLTAEIAVTGGANTFQWKKNGANIGSASTYSGTSSYYSISWAQLTDQGDYTLVVSNVAGSVTSNVATLTILPAAVPDNISSGGLVYVTPGNPFTLNIYSSQEWGTPLTYQWYKNGQAISGATSASYQVTSVTPAVMGEYFVTVTNSSGTGVSKTFYVTGERSDRLAYHWIDTTVFNHVAYFLYANTPRIARYDLLNRRWLSDWPLTAAPAAFAIASDYIYVASGSAVTRYNADFSSPTLLYTTAGQITGLLIKDQHLFVGSNNYPYSEYRSILRTTGELVAQKTVIYGPTAGFSYSAKRGKIFARESGIWSLQYFVDGQFGLTRDGPARNAFGGADKTQIVANGSLVVENGGVVYRTDDLQHVGGVGGYFHTLLPSADPGYYVLRGGVVAKLNAQFQETGRAAFGNFATFLAEEAGALIGFTQPSAAGQPAVVEELATASILPPIKAARLDPVGRQIWSPQIFADQTGVVSIYSRMDRQIYRWSASEARYLPSIPLASVPNFISYSAANQSYYYDRYAYQIRRLLLENEGETERPLHVATRPLIGLQAASRSVLFADDSGGWESHSVLNEAGDLVTWREMTHYSRQYEWNEATRRMYFFRDGTTPNDLLYEGIDPLGRITDSGETPYHGEVKTDLPIRVSADGSAVLLGSGEIYVGAGLSRLARLPVSVTDGVWLEGLLHTIRETAGGTEIQSWSVPGYTLARSTTAAGVPLRVLAIPGGRLLLVTTQSGVLTFRYFAADSLAELTPTSFGGAPLILAQPQSVTARRGGTAALVVAAQGTAPLSYQWYKGASPIPGATGAGFTIANMQAESTGDYVVEVTNPSGSVRSAVAAVAVTSLPVIAVQPVSRGARLGMSVNLTVEMAGSGPFLYQWMQGDAVVPYATNASLTISSLQLADVGEYTVVITGEGGSVVSAVATVAVVAPPVITQQPVSQAFNVGDEVTLSLAVTSVLPLSYQWKKGTAVIPGATAATYHIANFAVGNEGGYSVVVTNSEGSVTSNVATLVVAVAPTIAFQLAQQTVIAGATASFGVAVTSNAPLSYQWKKNGTDIDGATSATLSLSDVQASDEADYSVKVTNIAGSITSNAAHLTVQLPPMITVQPQSVSVLPTTNVTFAVEATSTTPLSYQWQRLPVGSGSWGDLANGSGISGVTSAQLTVSNVQLGNNGEQYRCAVSNVAGLVASNPSTLTVAAAGFVKLSPGRYHSLRVSLVSQLYATGLNTQGQLGTGNTASTTTAQLVTLGGQTITDAAAGAEHSLFLTNVKEVWATGLNSTGQLGDGTTTAKATPIKLATNAVGMAAGNFHSVVLKTDGSLWTVGGNDSGQLGNGTMTDTTTLAQVATSVVHAVAGIRQTLFLKSDGTLWAMGNLDGGDIGVSTPIQIATNVKTMAAGGYHSLFVKTDGTLWAMGYNPSGQLGTGDTTTRTTPVQVATGVEAVSAGYFFSVYLKTDRSLWAMGNNGGGQLGDGTTTARSTAVQVATNVATVATGENYTLFTKTDGTLWGTGYTANGQFGNGTTASLSTPAQLAAGVVLVPEAPTGLTATVATSPERAQLTWTPQGAATSYEVWRHTANDSASATRIAANQRWALYEDLAVTPGQAYYYWVKAVNSAGTSAVSAMATTASTLSQTITFNPLPDVAYSTTPITLSATASSSLPVTFSVVAGPATVTGSSLTLTGVGAVTVRASQAGNSAYDPAPNVARSFAVSKASAAVTLGSLSATYDGTPKSATATTNPSGLTVGFTYDGSATAPMNAGSYAVVGTIADALYQGSASGTLTIAPAAQTITFDPLADRGYTATPISLSATASSGLTVTFSVVTGPATVSGNSLTLNGAGTVTVRAEQVGNASYSAATAVERSFTVTANFDSWRLDHFTAPERADMNVSGPNAVFGQDGLPNLVKYALGLEPKVNDTSGLPEVTTTATDWVYTYMKPATVTDVTLAVEVSADLVTWSTTNVTLELVSSAGAIETWRATYPLSSAANAFFRLRVTQP